MRLKRLRPIYFRCYGNSDWINLDSALAILYGPNGYGKTCLVESIEWLLHGRAKRRERGRKRYSKLDYQNYYEHAHAPEDATTAVEAEVCVNGADYIIRRELCNGSNNEQSTSTLINGKEANLASIGLTEDSAYDPVIPQHSLQDFLLSKPKARRDKVSAALGLDPLVKFSTAVEKARKRFRRSPPESVKSAEDELRGAFQLMSNGPDASAPLELRAKWGNNKFDLSDDSKLLKTSIQNYLGSGAEEWDKLEQALRNRRDKAANRVFDVSPIQPPNQWQTILESLLETCETATKERIPEVSNALNNYLGAVAKTYSREFLTYWKKGLELQEDDTNLCPMCEEETLDESKREELKERLEEASSFEEADTELNQSSKPLADDIKGMARSISRLVPNFLDSNSRERLITLFSDPAECEDFLSLHDQTERAISKTKESLLQLAERIESLPDLANDANRIHEAKSIVNLAPKEITRAANCIKALVKSYANAFENFEERLSEIISSTEEVEQIDSFIAPLEHWNAVKTMAAHQDLLDESLEVERNVKEHLQNKQDELFNTRGQEIDKWYEMMNPRADVVFSRMHTGSESLRLYAETFGEELNAAAGLSQCQANCLGLSIHFMRALSPDSPFNFLVLDDPVQSMDDDHCQALLSDVVEELLDTENVQVIVCSHLQGLVDHLRYLYRDQDPIQMRISDFKKTGPVIQEAETVKSCIKQVKNLKQGNEDNRRLAMQILRRAVELLIRRTCEVNECNTPSHSATFGDMLPYFRNCPQTKQSHADKLKKTVDFVNPASHTQVGWSVPKESQITPHVNRIRQYAQQHYEVWEA